MQESEIKEEDMRDEKGWTATSFSLVTVGEAQEFTSAVEVREGLQGETHLLGPRKTQTHSGKLPGLEVQAWSGEQPCPPSVVTEGLRMCLTASALENGRLQRVFDHPKALHLSLYGG
ncbi:hypothetical protein EYF80_031134 [Liparis tanakae]|uniref:Uncharacterized protein n=1 Tax=Liparis tanakae TaxID=230148 RepID=A0A4Z2GZ96_9TELE|nr:hypothetical protein EYF80_031134 [Liparis tanakae]